MIFRNWEGKLIFTWPAIIVRLWFILTGDCLHGGCGYVEPYGFVPEADCPVHDR